MRNLFEIIKSELCINGVYKITCISNNKIYIGSCSAKDWIYTRLIHHRNDLISNRHQNKYLQRAFNKYGKEKFFVEILEICPSDQCIDKEQKWIDLLQPHYNMCKKAGSSFGRIVSEETRERISKANKKWIKDNPWFREKVRKLATGRIVSKENREKMAERIRERNLSRKYTFKKKIIDTATGIIYNSTAECRENLNLYEKRFYRIIRKQEDSEFKLEYYEAA